MEEAVRACRREKDAGERRKKVLRAYRDMLPSLKREELLRVQQAQKGRKRADLVAMKHLRAAMLLPQSATPGHVPGVAPGDRFRDRQELIIMGIHRQPRAGIDFVRLPHPDGQGGTLLLATAVVLSDGYQHDRDWGDMIEYSGGGGQNYRKQEQVEDQRLCGANEAMRNNLKWQKPVRLTRLRRKSRMAARSSREEKLYEYVGLYDVVGCHAKLAPSGAKVYVFMLKRRSE